MARSAHKKQKTAATRPGGPQPRGMASPAGSAPHNGGLLSTGGRLEKTMRYAIYPLLLVTVIVLLSVRPVSEPDCWFHMALGKHVIENRELPKADLFSFTGEGHEWISTGWFSSVILEYLYRHFGSKGLVLMVLAAVVPAFLAMYYTAVRRYGNHGSVTVVLMAAALASYVRFTPRPEVWSLLFMTVVSLLLVTSEGSPRNRPGGIPYRLWALPVLFILWANLHGGVFIGFVPVMVFMAWKCWQWYRTRRLSCLVALVPCFLAGAAWTLNPYGASMLKLVREVMDVPSIKQHLFEYLPLVTSANLLPKPLYAGFAALVVVAVWLVSRRSKHLPWWQIAVMGLFLVMALNERRHVGVAVFAMTALLVPHLRALDALVRRQRFVTPAIILAVAFSIAAMKQAGALGVGTGLMRSGLDGSTLPWKAVDYLRDNRPPDNMFNTYGPGGYLLYHLGPETKVFIDGRFFVYDKQVWEDFLAVRDGEMSIDEACERYDIRTFFLYTGKLDTTANPNHLANRLSARPDWKLVFFSDNYAVFVKDLPETRGYLDTREFLYATPYDLEKTRRSLENPATREKTMVEIRRAVEVSQNSGTAAALASIGATVMGDEDIARDLLSRALAICPYCPAARQLLAEKATLAFGK